MAAVAGSLVCLVVVVVDVLYLSVSTGCSQNDTQDLL